MGDFNVVLNGDERWGIGGFDSASGEFVSFVKLLGL